MTLTECLGKRILFFDGGMGTMLQKAGLPAGHRPDSWNLENPSAVKNVHLEYLRAGCDIIKTNTFGSHGANLEAQGCTVEEMVSAAVKLAREAVAECGRDALVAMDMGPTGKLLQPLGELSFDDAVHSFAEMAAAGEKAGADLILIETMSDLYEIKAAVTGAKKSTQLPIIATLAFDAQGKLLTGGDIQTAVTLLEGLGVTCLGFNCGLGPHQMEALLPILAGCCSVPMVVNPNAGLPRMVDGSAVFDVDPEEFAQAMEKIVEGGAWLVGGCCGTTPAHLAAVTARCCNLALVPVTVKNRTSICSYSKTLNFGGETILIGSRINSLKNPDIDTIVQEAFDQGDEGAEVLSLNLTQADSEESLMLSAIPELQSMLNTPLHLDSANPSILNQAARLYNGKALVSSCGNPPETVLEIAAACGGVAVLYAEKGNFNEYSLKLLESAENFKVSKNNLLIGYAVSDATQGQEALDTLEAIHNNTGLYTLLDGSCLPDGPDSSALLKQAVARGVAAILADPTLYS